MTAFPSHPQKLQLPWLKLVPHVGYRGAKVKQHRGKRKLAVALFASLALYACGAAPDEAAPPHDWAMAWPKTDFTKTSVGWDEIADGGPGKDGIRAIDRPRFIAGKSGASSAAGTAGTGDKHQLRC